VVDEEFLFAHAVKGARHVLIQLGELRDVRFAFAA
jgi:hypothetical protein